MPQSRIVQAVCAAAACVCTAAPRAQVLRPVSVVPANNPFVKKAGAAAEVWSLGHRHILGLTLHPETRRPETGDVWRSVHGPQGGDELNVIEPGRHHGWPLVTHGRHHGSGTRIGEEGPKPGCQHPWKGWVPSIAPSGINERVRDVRQGPDGWLRVLADGAQGRLIRLQLP